MEEIVTNVKTVEPIVEEVVVDEAIEQEVKEKSIAQQTNDLVTSIVGMVNELSEKGVFPKLPDDDMYEVDGNARDKIDKTADAAKKAFDRYDENKNMPQLKWYKFVAKIRQKNQKEENQREIINDLITAVENNADASKLLFNHIINLSTYSRKLLALGLEGIACNRIVVREVRARLKKASEEELDKLAEQELLLVLDELEKQNALEVKIDKAIEDITLKADKKELKELQEIFEESTNNLTDKLTQLSEDITQIRNNLNDKANVQEFKELQGQFNESAQNHSKELRELRENIVHSQTELNNQLSKKVDAQEVNKNLNKIRIAYIVTTALLTIGLIVSFII